MKTAQLTNTFFVPNKDYINLVSYTTWIQKLQCGLDQFEFIFRQKNYYLSDADLEFFFSLGNNLSLLLFHHGKKDLSRALCLGILRSFSARHCTDGRASALALQSYVNLVRQGRHEKQLVASEIEATIGAVINGYKELPLFDSVYDLSKLTDQEAYKTFLRSLRVDLLKTLLNESTYKVNSEVWNWVAKKEDALLSEFYIIQDQKKGCYESALEKSLLMSQKSQGLVLHAAMLRMATILKADGFDEEAESIVTKLLSYYVHTAEITAQNFEFALLLNQYVLDSTSLDLVYELTNKNFKFAETEKNEVGMLTTLQIFNAANFGDLDSKTLLLQLRNRTGYQNFRDAKAPNSINTFQLESMMEHFLELIPALLQKLQPQFQETESSMLTF
ncbi:hypothetical protein [Bdellovibrio reynosensis]|uniref:Uncharacterized protein n=1 Tax=Bdellovibrio reynosensis TaxID=2835041 RepID=A0ABY4C8I5_9BACT|nr:hypothetical protein [Bdellovibrio reynosensis]UOF00001.1 hypothetical protein MNR06_09840 [Bdellovibrio reynosensis]